MFLWRIIFFSIIGGASILNVSGQANPLDSLRQAVYSADTEVKLQEAISGLFTEYRNLERDTVDFYALKAYAFSQRTSDPRMQCIGSLCMACSYERFGWKDSTLAFAEDALKKVSVTDAHNRDLYFRAMRLKALSIASHSHYQEGLEVFYKLVSEAENYKDWQTFAENANTIASIALARNKPAEAVSWLKRALAVTGPATLESVKGAILVNLAEANLQMNRLDSASLYISEGVDIFNRRKSFFSLAIALQRQANIYVAQRKFAEAETALKKMIAVRNKSGDSSMYVDDNISLAKFYIQTSQLDKAIDFSKKALGDQSQDFTQHEGKINVSSIPLRLEYYQVLAECYRIKGDHPAYEKTLEDIISAKDTFYYYNSAAAIAELETKYDVQKKENTIIQQKLDITHKNSLFYGLIGLAFFLAVIAWLSFNGYKKREQLKMSMMMATQKEISKQSVAIAEEKERKRIAADLHDNLGAYAASIISNLEFIKPDDNEAGSVIALNELKKNSEAMVSQLNDTIWAFKKDALSLTAISDRIKIFIQRIDASYPGININVSEEIENDYILSPSYAFHLYRIAQEALNNALKHSKATDINISIISEKGNWKLTIADNGIGIQKGMEKAKPGNGLLNMQARAGEAGWEIYFETNQSAGLKVTINDFPEKHAAQIK